MSELSPLGVMWGACTRGDRVEVERLIKGPDCSQELLDHGLNAAVSTKDAPEYLDVANLLLDHGANVNSVDPYSAVELRSRATVQLLLDWGWQNMNLDGNGKLGNAA